VLYVTGYADLLTISIAKASEFGPDVHVSEIADELDSALNEYLVLLESTNPR
jgi:hypothetical protein